MKAVYIFCLMLLLNSCGTSYKVKDGQDAYNLKQYAVAVSMLKKELEQEPIMVWVPLYKRLMF